VPAFASASGLGIARVDSLTEGQNPLLCRHSTTVTPFDTLIAMLLDRHTDCNYLHAQLSICRSLHDWLSLIYRKLC
jgi:hypothetical protein